MAIITASPKTMARMIEVQEQSLGELQTLRSIFESGVATGSSATSKVLKPSDVDEELLEVQEQTLAEMKNDQKLRKEQIKKMDEEAEIIASLAENFKTFRSPFEKLKDSFNGVTEAFKNPGRSLMKSLNIGGLFDKKIAKSEFVEKQKDLGSSKTDKEIKADFEKANKIAKDLQKTEKDLEKLKKSTGLSESKLAQTPAGRKLLDKRAESAGQFKEVDLGANLTTEGSAPSALAPAPSALAPAPSALAPATPTQAFSDTAAAEEAQMENARLMDDQTTLLETIAANTAPATNASSGAPGPSSSGEGGGLMKGIGAGLKSLGGGLKGLGTGLGKGIQGLLTGIAKGIGAFGNARVLKGAASMVVLSGAMFIAGKAMQEFGSVEWEDVAKGMLTMAGLGVIAGALGKAGPSMIVGAGAMLILSGALWITGDALQKFQDMDWETIGKGMVAVAGLGALGAIAGTAAPLLLLGAAALGGLGASLWIIGEAMQAVGAGFQAMTDGLERLATLDGDKLTKVGDGLINLGLGMAAFGAGQAAAGLGTLVTNLLTIGQDSPVEQLIKVGNIGPGLINASVGVKDLAKGMIEFAGVDEDSMDAIDDFPWKKATEFVKAGGVIQMSGAVVASASSAADMAKVTAGSGSGGSNTVIAPTNVTNNRTTSVTPRSAIRNQDPTQRSWASKQLNW